MRLAIVFLIALLGLSACSADSWWCQQNPDDSYCSSWSGPGEDPAGWF